MDPENPNKNRWIGGPGTRHCPGTRLELRRPSQRLATRRLRAQGPQDESLGEKAEGLRAQGLLALGPRALRSWGLEVRSLASQSWAKP